MVSPEVNSHSRALWYGEWEGITPFQWDDASGTEKGGKTLFGLTDNALSDAAVMCRKKTARKEVGMGILWLALILGLWILLQAYILPKLGISTWMRNSCQVGDKDEKIVNINEKTNYETDHLK